MSVVQYLFNMEFEANWFDRVWRFDIFDIKYIDMMSYVNSIFNNSASIFLILVFRYRV